VEVIKKKICIRDFQCRTNPYLVNGLIPEDAICTGLTSHWGEVTGRTNGGAIVYYTGQTSSNAIISAIPILITLTIDDLGVKTDVCENWVAGKTYYMGETVYYNDYSYKCIVSESIGNAFNQLQWLITNRYAGNGYTVNYTGDSQIDTFRRHTKKDSDRDLYNPRTNSGFTDEHKNINGTYNKITGESKNTNNSKQNLYSYIIGYDLGKSTTTGIHYQDTANGLSSVNYHTSGLTQENSVLVSSIKLEHLIGLVEPVKRMIDVNIDRVTNTTFEKHLKFGEISGLDDLESYGNGYYKII